MLIYNNYYRDEGIRNICHEVKNGSEHAISRIAEYLIASGIADETTALIPAPQHKGWAEYTLDIAKIVSKETGAGVYDILKCSPHVPLYDMKYLNTCPDITFMVDRDIPEDKTLLFIDNVMSTGYTYTSCNKHFGNQLIPFIYAIDFTRMPVGMIVKEYGNYVIRNNEAGKLVLMRI